MSRFIVEGADLDDWEDLKILGKSVEVKSKYFDWYENAMKCLDFSPQALGGYLVNNLTSPDFQFFLLKNKTDDLLKIAGYLVILKQTQPCLKTPGRIENVGFIPAMFCMQGIDAQPLVDAVYDFCQYRNIPYVYGNVKVDGAYKHFLSHFGAREISRTLLVETEKLKNG